MKKVLPFLGLFLGLGLGWSLSPPDQSASPPEAKAPAETAPTLVEFLANRPKAPGPQGDPAAPAPETETGPETAVEPDEPPAGTETAGKPKAPEAGPAPGPAIRITPGQTPREILRRLRSSGRSVATQTLTVGRVDDSPPATAPRTQPHITQSLPAAGRSSAPRGNNYCPLVYNYQDWPGDIAYAVCMAESAGRPDAVNLRDNHGRCRGSYGLLQIACLHADPETMLDPEANVAMAVKIYKRNNSWQPWGAYTNGSYRRYLPRT